MMMLFREGDRKPADRPCYPKDVYHDRLRRRSNTKARIQRASRRRNRA